VPRLPHVLLMRACRIKVLVGFFQVRPGSSRRHLDRDAEGAKKLFISLQLPALWVATKNLVAIGKLRVMRWRLLHLNQLLPRPFSEGPSAGFICVA